MRQEALPGISWDQWTEAPVEAIRQNMARRADLEPKERTAENKRLRESAEKVSYGKTVQCTPLHCAHCLAGLTSEKAMDSHRDAIGHHRFFVELPEKAL